MLTVYGNHEKYFSFEFQTDKKYNEIKKTSAIIKNNKEFDMLQKSSFIKMSTIETIFLIFGIILFLIAICVLTILIIKFLFEHFHLDKKIKNKINKTNKDVISINNNEIAILENEIRKEELKAKLKTVKNEDFVICKYCGTNNSNKNNICSHCGAPLNK